MVLVFHAPSGCWKRLQRTRQLVSRNLHIMPWLYHPCSLAVHLLIYPCRSLHASCLLCAASREHIRLCPALKRCSCPLAVRASVYHPVCAPATLSSSRTMLIVRHVCTPAVSAMHSVTPQFKRVVFDEQMSKYRARAVIFIHFNARLCVQIIEFIIISSSFASMPSEVGLAEICVQVFASTLLS